MTREACYPHDIWCIDFQEDALLDGTKVKILNILDEFTRQWLFGKASFSTSANWVKRSLKHLFEQGNIPVSLRSDNGSEFIAHIVKAFLL
jgi:putative transposase